MFKFLKDLVKKENITPYFLTFDEVPGWLADEERKAKAELEAAATHSRDTIESFRRSIIAQVNALSFPEEKRQLHPKLERIAISSLPLFERTMAQTLAKPFPSDSEAFYTSAAECLKGCLKAVQGQGKYLQAVFPDEMKTLRATIHDFGREINTLTDAMKRLQERSARISEVQRVHDALREIQEGRAGAEGRRSQLDRRIADARVALLNLKKERSRIESEVEFRTCTGLRERIGSLEEELERTGREFTVISAALAHVFRKAEKVTGRKSDSAGAKAVRHVTELLSSHQVPSPKELAESLKITLPIVLPLIASGEVALKNKEERALFSEPERLVSILERSAAEYYSCTARLVAAKEDLAANPVVARLTQIETELRQIEKTIARGEAQGVELAQQQDDSAGAIPTLVDELDRTVAVLAGGRVRLQAGALNSMMEKREKSV